MNPALLPDYKSGRFVCQLRTVCTFLVSNYSGKIALLYLPAYGNRNVQYCYNGLFWSSINELETVERNVKELGLASAETSEFKSLPALGTG